MALAILGDPAGHYMHRLARPGALVRERWHVFYPLWTLVAVIAPLSLGVVWHGLFLLAFVGYAGNLLIRVLTAPRIRGEIGWFRQLGPLLSVAHRLTAFDAGATAAITGSLARIWSPFGGSAASRDG